MKAVSIAIIATCLALPLTASAGRLSTDDAGRLSAEMDSQKQEYLKKEFDGRSYEQLNSQEKRQYTKKSEEIEKNVLKENNVSRGDYSATMMRSTKNSPIEKSRQEHTKRIEDEKKAAEEKKAQEEQAKTSDQQSADGMGTSTENGVVVERGSATGSGIGGSFGGY